MLVCRFNFSVLVCPVHVRVCLGMGVRALFWIDPPTYTLFRLPAVLLSLSDGYRGLYWIYLPMMTSVRVMRGPIAVAVGNRFSDVPVHCTDSRSVVARHVIITPLPAIVKLEGICCFNLISTILPLLCTLYLYAAAHISSQMFTISPYLDRFPFIVTSVTSGGSPANRIILVPRPAISTTTC